MAKRSKEQIEADPTWGGMGALFRERGIKDYHLEYHPGVAAVLATEPPPLFYVRPLDQIEVKYDQDGYGACTFASECTAKSIEDFEDVGVWQVYDWLEAYKALGGTGPNGLVTDDTLRYARDVGLLQVGFQRRWHIQSYAFAPESPGDWRRTLAAALVATGPCVIALQLPTVFGWDSNTISMGPGFYHQMCLVGYDGLGDQDHAVFLNSWGPTFGQNGFCRIAWGYLEGNGFQGGYVYGYSLIDVKEGPPPPPPPPPPLIPVIRKVKPKKGGRALVVIGDFSDKAFAQIDGVTVPHSLRQRGWLYFAGLTLSSGAHQVVVVDTGAASAPKEFTL